MGHTTTLYGNSATSYADAIAAGNTIITEQFSVSSAPIADLLSFMNTGGRLIALGDSFIDTQLINPLFGTSLTIGSNPSAANWTKTAAAAGTTFADDPNAINWVSSTHSVVAGALPAGSTTFYDDPTWGTQVFRTAVGMGDFFYIGHDYCCGAFDREDTYLAVLDSAIRFSDSSVPIPLPAGLPLLLGGLGGLALFRRKRQA